MCLLRSLAKLSNLELKTRPKQLLGYLPLAFAQPDQISLKSEKTLRIFN